MKLILNCVMFTRVRRATDLSINKNIREFYVV